MPIKNTARNDSAGSFSLIYNNGSENSLIFTDKTDFQVFLKFLECYLTPPKNPIHIKKVFEVNGRSFQGVPHQPKNYYKQVELVAYNLSPFSFHLLLHQVTQGSLKKFMRSLCTRYSIYYNKKYHHDGPVFARPYKSITIENSHVSKLVRDFHTEVNHSVAVKNEKEPLIFRSEKETTHNIFEKGLDGVIPF